VQTFVQTITLHREGFAENQIALLVGRGQALVKEYLAIYHKHDTLACRERLAVQLQRLQGASETQKLQKGAQ
jgi:predicted transcriptional regulator